ncbi:helix-turn-helix domain-containing protein [Geodermatophilus sp. SYSU D00710]
MSTPSARAPARQSGPALSTRWSPVAEPGVIDGAGSAGPAAPAARARWYRQLSTRTGCAGASRGLHLQQYTAGRSLRELAELTDRSFSTVRNILDKHRVHRRPAGASPMRQPKSDS